MKKTASIIGASIAAVTFGAVLVGSTTALFTAERTTHVHIVSGSLDAKLYMTSIVRDEINEQGLIDIDQDVDLTEYTGYVEDYGVDLSQYSGYIFSDILLVPGMQGEATFKLYNQGDIAFNYYVSVNISHENADELYEDLSLTYPTQQTPGTVLVGESQEFKVSYEFLNDEDPNNNDAMDQTVSMDLTVYCVQVTRPSNELVP